MFELHTVESDALLVSHFKGILDAEAAQRIVEFLEEKEIEVETGFHRFCDLTLLEGIQLSIRDVRQLAARRREFNPNPVRVKSAFLAMDPLAFGVSRMYEQLLNSPRIEVRVWSDIEGAAEWLGVDLPRLLREETGP